MPNRDHTGPNGLGPRTGRANGLCRRNSGNNLESSVAALSSGPDNGEGSFGNGRGRGNGWGQGCGNGRGRGNGWGQGCGNGRGRGNGWGQGLQGRGNRWGFGRWLSRIGSSVQSESAQGTQSPEWASDRAELKRRDLQREAELLRAELSRVEAQLNAQAQQEK